MCATPDWLQIVTLIANVLMAVGAIGIFFQMWMTKRQSMTTFADSLNREYRKILHLLPYEVLLGKPLSKPQLAEHMDEMLYYFDLSNEQTFLRQQGRVSKENWDNWRDGIQANMKKPAFRLAWEKLVQSDSKDLAELRRLVSEEFRVDPRHWR